MPQVSKYPMKQEVSHRIFDLFLKTLSKLRSKNEIDLFLSELLTPTERIMLAKRVSVAFLLDKGYDYRQISYLLKVSTSTIGIIARDFKGSKGFKSKVKEVVREDKESEFWMKLGEDVTGTLASAGTKAGSWRYLHDKAKKKRRSKAF